MIVRKKEDEIMRLDDTQEHFATHISNRVLINAGMTDFYRQQLMRQIKCNSAYDIRFRTE